MLEETTTSAEGIDCGDFVILSFLVSSFSFETTTSDKYGVLGVYICDSSLHTSFILSFSFSMLMSMANGIPFCFSSLLLVLLISKSFFTSRGSLPFRYGWFNFDLLFRGE